MEIIDILLIIIVILVVALDIISDTLYYYTWLKKPLKIIEGILCIIGLILIFITI